MFKVKFYHLNFKLGRRKMPLRMHSSAEIKKMKGRLFLLLLDPCQKERRRTVRKQREEDLSEERNLANGLTPQMLKKGDVWISPVLF